MGQGEGVDSREVLVSRSRLEPPSGPSVVLVAFGRDVVRVCWSSGSYGLRGCARGSAHFVTGETRLMENARRELVAIPREARREREGRREVILAERGEGQLGKRGKEGPMRGPRSRLGQLALATRYVTQIIRIYHISLCRKCISSKTLVMELS
jgi:hypothetical protein